MKSMHSITITYAAEPRNLAKNITFKLRTAQRAHERIMLEITWKMQKIQSRFAFKKRETKKTKDYMRGGRN